MPVLDAASQSSRHPAIVILDFGSQYSELIARRVRETEVFSLVMGYTTTAEELKAIQPRGIILSGGPSSVYELRVARLAARYPEFSVAPQTMALMQDMVRAGEVNALVSERVWQELAKGLMAKQPSRLLQVLRECGALHVLLPEVDRLYGVPQPPEHHPEIDTGVHLEMVLDETARVHAPLEVRFAALCHDLGKGTTDKTLLPRHIGHEQRSVKLLRGLCERWRVPVPCRELAEVVAREHGHVHGAMSFGADALLRLLVRCDAIRRPDRFERVLMACECDARGRLGLQDRHYPQAAHLHNMLKAALSVDTASLSALAMQQGLSGMEVGAQIEQARVKAIASALADSQR